MESDILIRSTISTETDLTYVSLYVVSLEDLRSGGQMCPSGHFTRHYGFRATNEEEG